MTNLSFDKGARQAMKRGVDQLADAVKVTLGPKGRHVAIRRAPGMAPHVTKDGVTVARSIHSLEDPMEDMGANMIKEAATKTAILAGDGTTTATILAQSMINDGMALLDSGSNPMDLKRGIDYAVSTVVEALKKMSTPIQGDYNKIRNIATISANNDAEIGKIIGDAMEQVGEDGIITVAESKTSETYVVRSTGLELDKGFISHHFINDSGKRRCVLDNPLILIVERKISALLDIQHILEWSLSSKRPLLIIADDVDAEALATMVTNKLRNGAQWCAIKSPGLFSHKKEVLQDIATAVGAKVVSDEVGDVLKNTTRDFLGSAESVIVGDETTIIVGGKGTAAAISARTTAIKEQLNNLADEKSRKYTERRLARLGNGVATLYVGAYTELEMKEKKDRIDDALRATKAAIEEGIVPGGGVAYLRSMPKIDFTTLTEEEMKGANIVWHSLSKPIRCIIANAGEDVDRQMDLIAPMAFPGGYNAKTGRFGNLLEMGVIDPTKVVRVALEHAASVACMFLTTECGIFEV